MIKTHFFTNGVMKAGFNINLDRHHNFDNNSKLTITPKYLESEMIQVNNIIKKMKKLYARIINGC